jgi:hypothetical protein
VNGSDRNADTTGADADLEPPLRVDRLIELMRTLADTPLDVRRQEGEA